MLSVNDLKVYFQLDGNVSRAVDGVSFDIGKERQSALLENRAAEKLYLP